MTYVWNFLSFYSELEVDLTLFCEEDFKNFLDPIIKNHPNFRSKVNFEIIDRNNLSYFSKLDEIRKIQQSEKLKITISGHTSKVPEYTRPEYVATMFSKPEILKLAKNRNLIEDNDKQVAWIDFGIAHRAPDFIGAIRGKRLVERDTVDKVILFNRKEIFPPDNVETFFALDDNVFVPGGFFVVPSVLIEKFYEEFNSIVNYQLFEKSLIDDDQTVLSLIANDKSLCHVINSTQWLNNPPEGDWFPVFDFLSHSENKNE
jgi:hypothetical protein